MSRRRSNVRQYSAEDQALTDISQEAENRLAAKRAARAEAREIRMKEIERQQKEAEEKERLGSDYGSSRSRQQSVTASSGSRRGSFDSEGTNDSTSSRDRDLKMELRTLEEKYKAAMMTSAQLDNEKQSLVYQVELLKDQLEELTESHTELQREYKDKNRNLEMTKRELQTAQSEVKALRDQNDYKDRLITESGFVIVAAENGELALERSEESPSANGPVGTGGLLLSSESLGLLNKGREGSLGMHSLASSYSATHTTQSAPSTTQSQPPSHTHAEEPQPESPVQTKSNENVIASQDSEGSCVDGPMFQRSPGDGDETGVGSSPQAAGDAGTGVCAEAVDAHSDQPCAAVSHSPGDRESQKPVQQAEANAPASSGDTDNSFSGKGVAENVSEPAASHEGMGSERAEESTSDGMLTPLHENVSESCEDKGQKVSDGSGGEDQTDSQSNLPSVVVTQCSHNQRNPSQDSEDDDIEFFDAVSTPLPSPMEKHFEYAETGAGTGENTAAEATSAEHSVKDVREEGTDVDGEDVKRAVGEVGEEGAQEEGSEVDGKGDTGIAGDDGEDTVVEDVKEDDVEEGKEGYEEDRKAVEKEDSKADMEEGKEVEKEDGKADVEEGKEVEKEDSEADVEAEKQVHKEEGKEIVEKGVTSDAKELASDNKEDKQEVDSKSDPEALNIQADLTDTGSKVCDENQHADNATDYDATVTQNTIEVDVETCVSAKSDVETCEDMVEKGGVEDVCEEGRKEQESVRKNSGVGVDVSKSVDDTLQQGQTPCNEMGAESQEITGAQHTQDNEEEPKEEVSKQTEDLVCKDTSEKDNTLKSLSSDKGSDELTVSSDDVHPAPSSCNESGDMHNTSQGEMQSDENLGEPCMSEPDGVHTKSVCEEDADHSAPTDLQEDKPSDENDENSDQKSKETCIDQRQTEPHPSEDDSKADAEGAVKEDSSLETESKECQEDKEEKNVMPEEEADALSPMLATRKPMNRKVSEGGMSEDSEAQLNDDEYDFDDIDAVLDDGSPLASERKDDKPSAGGDADDKVSFGSKDSGLQDSFANRESEATTEDTVSFGSRDSDLQESVHMKEGETGSGDTVSMRSKDSGAGLEDVSSLQSQDSSSGKPTAEGEEGAVGGELGSHLPVAGSRESLDLEAKLDKMVSQDTPSKGKHGHKKSKRFKMFKNIFK